MNSGPALTLRLAHLHEAPTLAAMSRELIEAGLAWRYTPARVATLMGDPDTVALVACEATRIDGFALMHFGDEEAHLILLCVRPAHHRRGIGRRLNDWLTASARVAGIASIGLELRADNAAALAFYRCLGYEETGQVPGYYEGHLAARRMVRHLRSGAPAS